MKVFISGYYGFHNLGDELILHHLCQVLTRIRSDLQVSVVSGDPAYTTRLHHVRGIDRNDYAAITQEVKNADLVVLGGGGLFQDHHRIDVSQIFTAPQFGITSYANVPHLAKIFQKPVAYLFQGVGPLFSDEALRFSQWAFSLADLIIVRDEASLALLERLGIQKVVLGLDPVLLGPKVDSTPTPTSRVRIGISLRQWIHSELEDQVVQAVAEFINQLQTDSENVEVRLLSFQEFDASNRDSLVLDKVLNAVRDSSHIDLVRLSECGVTDAERIFANLDYVIGMRFHALLLALKYKTPFLALGYDQKVHSLMQELRLKEYLIDLTSVTPEKILKTFLRLREQSSVCVTQLEAIHQEQAVRVETCLQALRQFLEPLGSSPVASIPQWEPNKGPDWVSVTEYEYLRAHLNEIRKELWANQGQLSLAQEHLAERDARIQSQQDGLAERAQTIEQLENTVQSQQAGLVERDGTIVHQQETIVHQQETIVHQQETIVHQQEMLNSISQSVGWKFIMAFGSVKDRVLPDGSRRRKLYDSLLLWTKRRLISRQAMPERDGQVHNLTQDVEEHDSQFAQMTTSRSWGMTARILACKRRMQDLGKWSRKLPSLAKKFWFICRHDGWRMAFVRTKATIRNIWSMVHQKEIVHSGLHPSPDPYVDVDPYAYVEMLKPIDIVVIDNSYEQAKRSEKFSLIVTVLNEEAGIQSFLESIARQSWVPDEIVVVDGGSVDRTAEQIELLSLNYKLNLTLLRSPGATIAAGRNMAIFHALNELVVVTDVGCTLEPDFCRSLVGSLSDFPEASLVGGIYCAAQGAKAAEHFIHEWNTNDWVQFLPSSRSLLIRKSLWGVVGGYPEFLSKTGEDTLFDIWYRQHSQSWVFNKSAVVIWQGPSCTDEALCLARSYAYGDGESGVGDMRFYSVFKRDMSSGECPQVTDIHSALAAGYLEGRKHRPKCELSARNLKGLVIILSDVPITDSGGGRRGAQLALEFAQQGFKVIYVNVCPSLEVPQKIYFDVDFTLIELYHLRDLEIRRVLDEYEPLMDRAIMLLECPHPDVVPILEEVKGRERRPKIIYDSIDNGRFLLEWTWYTRDIEEKIINHADHLVAAAGALQKELRQRTARGVTLIPNAYNANLFDPTRTYLRPRDFPDGFERIVLYVGSLCGEWFDWDLLNAVAAAMPESAFVLIGNSSPEIQSKVDSNINNVFFLGLKAQFSLPSYLAFADVCIIPFKSDSLTKHMNPLQVYEYLAMRKPIVTTAMEELEKLPGIRISYSRDEFIDNLRLSNGDEEIFDYNEFLLKHSWAERVATLDKLLLRDMEEPLPPLSEVSLEILLRREFSQNSIADWEGVLKPSSNALSAEVLANQPRRPIVHEEDFHVLRNFVQPHDLCMDIGANQGQSVISIRSVNKEIPIVSFEPNPLLVAALHNIASELRGVTVHEFGLGESDLECDLWTPVVDGLLVTPLASTDRKQLEDPEMRAFIQRLSVGGEVAVLRQRVKIRRGDAFMVSPSFVKIDVEGGELDVVRGLSATLATYKPMLMIEKSRNTRLLASYLEPLGYLSYRYQAENNMLTPIGSFSNNTFDEKSLPLNVFYVYQERLAEVESRGIKLGQR